MLPEAQRALDQMPDLPNQTERLLWALKQGYTSRRVLFEIMAGRPFEPKYSAKHLHVIVSFLRRRGHEIVWNKGYSLNG